MPLLVSVDPSRRVVISRGWGSVSDDDLIHGREQLQKDPAFDQSFDRIWDLSGATSLDLSQELLHEFAATSLSLERVQRAIVCVAPRVAERVLDFVSECRKFHRDVLLFPTQDQAADWMGLNQRG